MNRFLFLILFFLTACSGVSPQKMEQKRDLAMEDWKGRSTEELLKHPYFKNLPVNKIKHPDGRETWVFRDQARYQSSAYCQSLGGCIGMPYYNCDNAFSVENHVILGFQQNGSCPPVGTIEAEKKPRG